MRLHSERQAIMPGPWPRLALGLTLLAGALSAWVNWRCWINPFIDSPREMNVPARLAAGERLYRDVAYHYGPAGPWVNAVSIRFLGRRFIALELTGALAGGLLLFSLYRLASRAGSPLAAGVATVWSAALCVGAPKGAFLFPYAFGSLFAFAGGFLCLAEASRPVCRSSILFGSLGLALALTGKPEVGAASAVILAVALARSGKRSDEARRTLPILLGGFLLATIAYAFAFAGLSFRDLWPEGPMVLFHPPAEWRNVYRWVSGMARPADSASAVATAFFLDIVLLSPLAFSAHKWPSRWAAALWVLFVAGGTLFFSLSRGASIEDRLPPLLSPMPAVAAVAALVCLRRPLGDPMRPRFLLFGFAAAMATRVLFGLAYGAVTNPYAILAFSGLCASAAVLAIDLPRSLRSSTLWRRGVALLFLSLAIVALARWERYQRLERRIPLSTSAGSLRLPGQLATPTAQTLAYLAERAGGGDGLTGFPEGGFFNFVLNLPNPLREEQVFPGHLDAAEERRVADRLALGGPRFILLANLPSTAFGPVGFGQDYARLLWAEVERHYRLGASFGAPAQARIGMPPFFLRVYERKPAM